MFLADRFIKGTCPKCGAPDQYGDSCEVCASVYRPTDLINPYSALSGSKLELRKSKHFFFKLSDPNCVEFLRDGRAVPLLTARRVCSPRLSPKQLNGWAKTEI